MQPDRATAERDSETASREYQSSGRDVEFGDGTAGLGPGGGSGPNTIRKTPNVESGASGRLSSAVGGRFVVATAG